MSLPEGKSTVKKKSYFKNTSSRSFACFFRKCLKATRHCSLFFSLFLLCSSLHTHFPIYLQESLIQRRIELKWFTWIPLYFAKKEKLRSVTQHTTPCAPQFACLSPTVSSLLSRQLVVFIIKVFEVWYLVERGECGETQWQVTVPIRRWLTDNMKHSFCSQADSCLTSRTISQILLNPKI